MNDYAGKNIWIIGASSGIGRAVAVELAARGANLVLSSRDAKSLTEVAAKMAAMPMIAPCDAADGAAVQDAYAAIAARMQLDSVIYLAGQYTPAAIADMDMANAASTIAVNLTGAMHVTHAVLPDFLRRKQGQVALCASVAGYRGLPNAQPYGATKAALINFAESLRAEVISSGVDVKLINPGFVRTRLTAKNDFSMPMMIEPEQAARAIADGLLRGGFEIRFPYFFTLLVKMLSLLPAWLYFALVKK